LILVTSPEKGMKAMDKNWYARELVRRTTGLRDEAFEVIWFTIDNEGRYSVYYETDGYRELTHEYSN